jgi:hypothetical protein
MPQKCKGGTRHGVRRACNVGSARACITACTRLSRPRYRACMRACVTADGRGGASRMGALRQGAPCEGWGHADRAGGEGARSWLRPGGPSRWGIGGAAREGLPLGLRRGAGQGKGRTGRLPWTPAAARHCSPTRPARSFNARPLAQPPARSFGRPPARSTARSLNRPSVGSTPSPGAEGAAVEGGRVAQGRHARGGGRGWGGVGTGDCATGGGVGYASSHYATSSPRFSG